MIPLRAPLLVVLGCAAHLGCGGAQRAPRAAPGVETASITVTSPSFSSGGHIPVDFTCDGADVMPELVLSAPPEGTKSLALIVDDPDAPRGTTTHMIAFDISPEVHRLPGGADLAGAGEAARFGLNDFDTARYEGPCPPRGELRRYRFRVIALDTVLSLPEGAPRARIDAAMDGHVVGAGALVGLFGH